MTLVRVRELLDLVWSQSCVGCAQVGTGWCDACRERLRGAGPVRAAPEPCPAGMPTTWAGTTYSETASVVIRAWKDDDRPHLGATLVPLLARALRQAVSGSPTWQHALRERPALVVPVPSRPAGTRHRGRYPVYELVRRLVSRSPEAMRPLPALAVSPAVRDQAGLTHEARADNLAGSMWVRAPHRDVLRGTPVVLVDDVVTTGATLAEAARVLTRCGAGPLLAVTVAATPRHRGSCAGQGVTTFCVERGHG